MVWYLKKMTDGLGADAASTRSAARPPAARCSARSASGLKLQAGAATALHWAIDSVRKGGDVSIVGVYGPAVERSSPIGNAMNKGLTLRMNQAA